jgi:aspartate aminotransferase
VSYEAIIRFVGGVPAFVPLESEQGFVLTAERLRSALTPRTRMILVNSPNNPTGRALTREEVTAVAEVAEEADLLIISDEIYEKILYDDREAISLGTMPGCLERTLTINGFSKAYAMTGWRLGYVAGPQEIIAEVLKAQQHTVGCAGSFVQAGGLAALTGSQDCVAEMVAEYATRRNFIAEALDELPGVRCPKPDGAFYVFPQVEASMFGDDTAFTNWLLESAGVAVTPGCAFGPGGAGHVRMSFANSQTILEGALEAMRRVWPSS